MSDILIIFALILLNGVFSMSELALASAKQLRLQEMAGKGRQGAQVAIDLAQDPSAFLSTVQVGITLISIFNGAFGEASLVERLTPQLAAVPAVAPYARQLALGIVIVDITFFSIILGELVPKRVAMQHPEGVAAMVARPLKRLSWLMAPFVKTLSVVTELILRLLGLHKPKDDAPTQQEISGMLKEGTDAGVLDKIGYDIARRAMRLNAQRLAALMTSRVDLQEIDLDDSVQVNLVKIVVSPYSRFPVFSHDRSNIVGIVHAGDLLEQAVHQNTLSGIDIAAAAKPALFVPASVTAPASWNSFARTAPRLPW